MILGRPTVKGLHSLRTGPDRTLLNALDAITSILPKTSPKIPTTTTTISIIIRRSLSPSQTTPYYTTSPQSSKNMDTVQKLHGRRLTFTSAARGGPHGTDDDAPARRKEYRVSCGAQGEATGALCNGVDTRSERTQYGKDVYWSKELEKLLKNVL